MKSVVAKSCGPVIMDSEFAVVTAGSWPRRLVCTIKTPIQTMLLGTWLDAAKVSGHQWREHATSKWAGQLLVCRFCGAIHEQKKP